MKQVSLSGLLAVSAMMSIAGASTLSADQAVSVGTQSEENSNWDFNAGLTIGQEYTDNAFLTANDRRDDFITTVFPWATLSMRTDDSQLNLDASAEIGRYSSYSSEDYNDYSLGAEAHYRLGRRIFAFGGLGFDKDNESRDSPDDVNGLEPTEYREKSGFLGVGGRFDDRLYRFGISIQDLDFDDTPAAGGSPSTTMAGTGNRRK